MGITFGNKEDSEKRVVYTVVSGQELPAKYVGIYQQRAFDMFNEIIESGKKAVMSGEYVLMHDKTSRRS